MKRRAKEIFWVFLSGFVRLVPREKDKNVMRGLLFRLLHKLPPKILANPGETVVHAGCWSIETIRKWHNSVGPEGTVVIIEANDSSYDTLKAELEDRYKHFRNVTLVHKAAWNKKEKVTVDEYDRPGSNKIAEARTYYEFDIGQYKRKKLVEADTIDNILTDIGIEKVDHVHLTINGAELEAIKGMVNTLETEGVRIFVMCETILNETNRMVTGKACRILMSRGLNTWCHNYMPLRPDHIYGIKMQ